MDKHEKKERTSPLDKGDEDMTTAALNKTNFADFMKQNKEKLYKIAEANTTKNAEGIPVITKDDPWRDEKEWDEHCNSLAKK